MQQLLPMSLRQLNILDVLQRVSRGELTAVKAGELLELHEHRVREKVRRLAIEGPKSLQHGLKGRPSNNALSIKERKEIEHLLQTKYLDFGPTLATEKLAELHRIIRDTKTIRAIQIQLNLWQPDTRRTKAQHRFFRERKEAYGELEQFDGCYHDWLEGRGGIGKICLLLAIDDARGVITHARFAPHEGVLPVMGFWLEYIGKRGIPKAIYLDRFSTYSMNMKTAKENPDTLTQFERAAKEVGIQIIHAMSPQAKGRVERVFKTLQDRLVKELRLQAISTVGEANAFLQEAFIPVFNKKFGVKAKHAGDLHRSSAKRELRDILPYIFCRREERTIRNDFTIPYNQYWFQLLPTPSLALRPKESVQVHELPGGDICLRVRGRTASYHTLPDRPQKTQQKASTLV